jgi:predicted nucleic acid-binding protein
VALISRYLLDTRAAAWMSHPEVAACLAPSSLSSARNPVEYEQLWAGRRVAYEYLLTEGEHRQAALQAQRELARQGRHRAVGIPDLLTAVMAAEHGLTVVHYDADFEIAATVVAFEQVGVAQRGSL